jgi:serine/threonine protein kinase
MLDAFETPTHVEIVMELMEGGELYGRIASKGPYPEAKAALIIRRLASAVRFLHRHGVVHRDLKPENLLLASSENDDMIKVRWARHALALLQRPWCILCALYTECACLRMCS